MPLSEYPEPVVKHTGHNGPKKRERERERERERTSTIKNPSLRWILVLRVEWLLMASRRGWQSNGGTRMMDSKRHSLPFLWHECSPSLTD